MHATCLKLPVSLSFRETIRSFSDWTGHVYMYVCPYQQASVSHFAMFWLPLVFVSPLSCQRGTFYCYVHVTVPAWCKVGFICFLPAKKAFAAALDEVEDKAIANSLAAT